MQNIDSKYTAEIYSRTGQLIAVFSDVLSGREFVVRRNKSGTLQWSIDLNTLEQIADEIGVHPRSILGAGQNEIRIRRFNRYLWGGRIMQYTGDLGLRKSTIDVQAVDWLELLAKRFTEPNTSYSSTDAGLIAWGEIDATQQKSYGSFGITQGTIQTTVNRDRTYSERKKIKDLITDLTEVINGFDFEITYNKVFNVYSQIGVRRDNVAFEYPGNIKSLKIETSALKIANKVYGVGQGFGDGQVEGSYEDTSTQSSYDLQEDIKSYPSVSEQATLEAHAEEEVQTRKAPTQTIEAVIDGNQQPHIGSYWIGDRVPFRVNDHPLYDNIDAYYQIDEIKVKIDEDDNETINLRFSTNTAET